MNEWMVKQTDGQTTRGTDRQVHKWMNGWMVKQTDGQTTGRTDTQIHKWINGWMAKGKTHNLPGIYLLSSRIIIDYFNMNIWIFTYLVSIKKCKLQSEKVIVNLNSVNCPRLPLII